MEVPLLQRTIIAPYTANMILERRQSQIGAQFHKCICLYDLERMAFSRLFIVTTVIRAEAGAGACGRILQKNAIMKALIASFFALTLLSAGAADAAMVGAHV